MRRVVQVVVRTLAAPFIAAVAAIAISSVALLLSGNDPVEAFREMWKTIDSTESVVLIINRAVPYYVAGVAVAIGFRMNLFNIGANGQYILAALLAAWVGSEVELWPPLHVTLMFAVAISVGAGWAAIAGVLKVTRNVNEVISTIMLNFIATGIVAFLLSERFRDTATEGLVAQTKPIPESGRLPALNRLVELSGFHLGDVRLLGFLPYAIAVGVGYHVLLNRSRFGYELRLSGTNADAARFAGVNPKAMVLKTIILSGAVAGLIGMHSLMADPQFGKYGDQFPTQLGFTGISLALLGRNHPVGIAAAALVWATIERATQRLSTLGIPPEIGRILQGSFLLSAIIAYEVVRRRNAAAAAAEAARAVHEAPGGPPPPAASGSLAAAPV
jgi:general nucleoside transport system permease protein